METKTLVLLLVLFTKTIVTSADSDADSDGHETVQIYEETDVILGDGTVFHDSKVIDANCQYENDTATLSDQSTSTILNDYADNKSVVLFSNDTSVCYVRDIPDEEKKVVSTCEQGTVERQKDEPSEVKTVFVEGQELSIDDLPEALKGQCEGRRIVKMVEKPAEGPGPH